MRMRTAEPDRDRDPTAEPDRDRDPLFPRVDRRGRSSNARPVRSVGACLSLLSRCQSSQDAAKMSDAVLDTVLGVLFSTDWVPICCPVGLGRYGGFDAETDMAIL